MCKMALVTYLITCDRRIFTASCQLRDKSPCESHAIVERPESSARVRRMLGRTTAQAVIAVVSERELEQELDSGGEG